MQMSKPVERSWSELLETLPPAWPEDLRTANRMCLNARRRKVLVLDDDPTGTQTVHDLWVLTRWGWDDLAAALAPDAPAVTYLLTNSRSLPEAEAAALSRQIAERAGAGAKELGVALVVEYPESVTA